MVELDNLRRRLEREPVVVLEVKVIARSDRSQLMEVMADGTVKAKIAAVPEKGKANEELRHVLADFFDVAKANVEIIAGQTSQHKRVRVRR